MNTLWKNIEIETFLNTKHILSEQYLGILLYRCTFEHVRFYTPVYFIIYLLVEFNLYTLFVTLINFFV